VYESRGVIYRDDIWHLTASVSTLRAQHRSVMVCRSADYCRKNSIWNMHPCSICISAETCILVTFDGILAVAVRLRSTRGPQDHNDSGSSFHCIAFIYSYTHCAIFS
jgi:hypothetical protein